MKIVKISKEEKKTMEDALSITLPMDASLQTIELRATGDYIDTLIKKTFANPEKKYTAEELCIVLRNVKASFSLQEAQLISKNRYKRKNQLTINSPIPNNFL